MSRLVSLDVFRGATIAAMLLVNNPGNWSATYKPLLHAEWHGWTFTDTIFPFFLWIVGVAIPLSTARRLEAGQTRSQLLKHALRRALILFALGLFLSTLTYVLNGSLFRDGLWAWLGNYLHTVRIPGVLQRIAVCYFVSILIFLRCGLRAQVAVVVSLLTAHWLLLMLMPVPGYGAGVLEKEGNLQQYIDSHVLNGPWIGTHVWKTAKTWDPEGILSTLPAIATCLFGVLAGHLLRSSQTREQQTAWLFTAGNLLLAAGLVMHPWMPINKNLWTSTYAVFMAGLAANVFACSYWIIDVQGWRSWSKPFEIFGKNAIAMFVLSGVIGRVMIEIMVPSGGKHVALKTWLYERLFVPLFDPATAPLPLLATPENASLVWAFSHIAMLYAVAWLMHRRGWVIKI